MKVYPYLLYEDEFLCGRDVLEVIFEEKADLFHINLSVRHGHMVLMLIVLFCRSKNFSC